MSSAEPWTVGRLLQWTTDYLKERGADSPRLDAEVLLARALGCRRIELYTRFDEQPGDESRAAFRALVRRRAEGAPVAYLVGRREFFSLSFRVTPEVLIPRPETELLVVAALDLAKDHGEGRRGMGDDRGLGTLVPSDVCGETESRKQTTDHYLSIADVGTGSGCIAVCLAKHLPTCRVTAIDTSPAALAVAEENARQHGLAERIEFVESDLLAALPDGGKFDFVVSNPPYVAEGEWAGLAPDVRDFEPRGALVAGPRGTEVIERLIPQAAERLRPGGHLLMEIGPAIHDAVCSLLNADGRFEVGPTIKDLARLPRVVQAKRR
ncbi:MAG: peptide chain release factor N(5)-glutamine methyltransferase [Planctomycetes bacterium]|nr:peptide chain release factor N(5)-glutamine methyltransferase [Planctomycetota bacterium]MCG2685011.1 peptide chain release factor N(5)-glutamine methyltransferase [Planctomycetales bacterium]